ncbi:MAG: DUF2306 domain-containing protein [Bacteroidia bacterium]|nr:DUF2306 domain-containing protein [Bacteroidia bacterium]
MENLLMIIRLIHIVGGTLALLFGLGALVSKKGQKIHRISGQVYFWSMLAVFITALGLAILRLNPFLLLVAVFSFHLVASGYRSLYLKQLHPRVKKPPGLTGCW